MDQDWTDSLYGPGLDRQFTWTRTEQTRIEKTVYMDQDWTDSSTSTGEVYIDKILRYIILIRKLLTVFFLI
jgi:hypothetical protein